MFFYLTICFTLVFLFLSLFSLSATIINHPCLIYACLIILGPTFVSITDRVHSGEVKAFRVTNVLCLSLDAHKQTVTRVQCPFTVEAFLWVMCRVHCNLQWFWMGMSLHLNTITLGRSNYRTHSSTALKTRDFTVWRAKKECITQSCVACFTKTKKQRNIFGKICLRLFPYNDTSKMTVIPEIWILYTLNPKWPLDLSLSFMLLLSELLGSVLVCSTNPVVFDHSV